jgi:phage tail-like protein
MTITADKRGYVAGKYGIELGGALAGWVQSVEGGHAFSDVVNEKLGPDHIIHKHIAGVKYEDITITCGTGMTKPFYEWIKGSFDRKYARQDGAVVTADYNYNEISRMTFNHALISEIGFPALDASSKDAARMTVKIVPEYTRTTKGSGKQLGKVDTKIQKKWLPSNFRLKIDGLDCTRVNKIDAIVLKQKVVENSVGELRDYEKEPAHLEIPNLVVTLAESHADSWYKWHEDFVIKGDNGEDKEKGGTLEYLTPDLKESLFTITFLHAGIFKLDPEKVVTGLETIRRLTAELYIQDMKFGYHAAWA